MKSPTSTTVILNATQLQHTIRRIALQIYEIFYKEDEIVLAGIEKSGYFFAERLKHCLNEMSNLNVILCRVKMNKSEVTLPVQTSLEPSQYQNKPLVLVDDVLNSGSVLMYAVKHFLDVPLKDFKTAVLINRNHKRYPIKADFKGLSLSTSLQEHVEVDFENEVVYLA